MGFAEVYDYTPSKVDWMARGLPLEGERAHVRRAADLARTDVATCGLEDRVGAVRAQVQRSPFGFALVLAPNGAVLGRLPKAALGADPETPAEQVMVPGPSTNRPNVDPEKLLEKLQSRDLTTAILTDPDGRLLGVVRRHELEQALSDD